MDLYTIDQKPLRKKDKEAYYYDDHGDLVKVPSMFGSKEEIFSFLRICVKKTIPGATDVMIEDVWAEAETKKKIVIEAMEELKKEHEITGDRFRTMAYVRAIPQIKKLKVPLLSGDQALKIKGIGKGIASHIDEIIKSGKLKSLEEREKGKKERHSILDKFMKIWGVGPKIAADWYAKGYREIDDVPEEEITAQQKVGIKYYDEIQDRIPRRDVTKIFEAVRDAVKDMVATVDIVGSYRRGAADSSDVDIIITVDEPISKTLMKSIVKRLEDKEIVTDAPVLGAQKFMGLVLAEGVHRRLDIYILPHDERGSALMHATGPQTFNIHIREQASQMGYKLNEHGLVRLDDDEKIPTPNEEDVFKVLGMNYIDPEDRF